MTVHSLESGGSGYFYNLYIFEVMGLIPRGFSHTLSAKYVTACPGLFPNDCWEWLQHLHG